MCLCFKDLPGSGSTLGVVADERQVNIVLANAVEIRNTRVGDGVGRHDAAVAVELVAVEVTTEILSAT